MGNSKTKPEQSNSKEPTNENNDPSAPQLQIRNCIRNVRGVNGSFTDMYPNEAGTSCGQPNRSSVYTIDVPSNYANPGYVSTEGAVKTSNNDGLPSYEEAVGGVKQTIYPELPTDPELPRSTVEVVNEENQNVSSSRGRRHRHHRRHRNRGADQSNENSQPDGPEESRRHRHRRGFRLKRHLAKMNRRDQTD